MAKIIIKFIVNLFFFSIFLTMLYFSGDRFIDLMFRDTSFILDHFIIFSISIMFTIVVGIIGLKLSPKYTSDDTEIIRQAGEGFAKIIVNDDK